MLKLSDARNFRRTGAALALIAAPILLLLNSLITTYAGENTAEYVAEVATRRGSEEASAVLGILGFALLIPGIVGALNLSAHAGRCWVTWAAPCRYSVWRVFRRSSVHRSSTWPPPRLALTRRLTSIVERVEDLGGAIIVVAVALIGTLLGFLLLAAAFIRARTVPLFVPVLIIVGIIVVGPVGGGSESRIPQVIGNLLLLGGFGTIGLILLRQTDEEWERPGLATGGTAVATGAPAARPAGTSEGSSGTG